MARTVQRLTEQLEEKDRILQSLQAQWSATSNSPAWLIARWLVGLRERLAPPATLRDRLLDLGFYALHVWKREGLLAAARQARRRMQTWWPRKTESLEGTPLADDYQAWIREYESQPTNLIQRRPASAAFDYQPLVCVLVKVPPGRERAVDEAIARIVAQTYTHWECCLWGEHAEELRSAASRFQDKRVRAIPFQNNQKPEVEGQFILPLNVSDRLAPEALYEMAALLNRQPEVDLVYWDEDQLSADGQRCKPWFKPQWSPELLLSTNYLRSSLVRREVWDKVAALVLEPIQFDEARDWEFSFRCAEQTQQIAHIPKILTHRLLTEAEPANLEALQRRVEAHAQRLGIEHPAAVFSAPAQAFRLTWPTRRRLISIIIPNKNNADFLKKCLTSVLELTTYPDFEVIIVDNASHDPQVLAYYDTMRANARVRIIDYPESFNYSAANNLGARHATGDLLVFLNNDTEALEPDWLEELARWAERPEIGAVGAKLLYPDGTIQHAGVVMGMEGHSSHVFWGAPEGHTGPFGSVEWYRNYMAVTAACVMMRRDVFEQVGGFDEDYELVFSDVEICLRLIQHGYRVMYTPFARLRHYEGRSRAQRMPTADIQRAYVHMRHIVEAGDPYYNPNLSYSRRVPSLAQSDEENRVSRLARLSGMGTGSGESDGRRPDSQLPYEATLTAAGAVGRVLHRADIYGSGPPNPTANPEVLSLILRYARTPLLDVGCGIGPYVGAIGEKGLRACGLEINADYVKQAVALNRDVRHYEGRAIPFPDNQFDTTIAIEVLEHIPDWEYTLKEMLRVTQRCVLISVPNIGVIPSMSRHLVVPWHILEATHVNFFTADILANYLNRLPALTSQLFTYGAFPINGEVYHNHVFAVILKRRGNPA